VKGRRMAKAWLAKAHDSIEGARKHMGLQLWRASKLNVARQCQHNTPPAESRPCEEQAQAAIQRADCAWEGGPRRMRELCCEYPDRAGWPTGGIVPVRRRAAAPSSLRALWTMRAIRTCPSPATRIPPIPRHRTPIHKRPRQRTPIHQRPRQRAPIHQRPRRRTLPHST
jgi:hypothetical protein